MLSTIPTHTENPHRIDGDIAYIALTDRQGNTLAEAIVDRENLDRCLTFARWHLHPAGYAVCTPNRHNGKERVLLHRLIMNMPAGRVVDHIHGHRLDCRKSELRIARQAENCQNKTGIPKGRSGVQNVHWHRETGKWQVKIGVGGCTHTFGLYADLAVAAEVALNARRSLHPFCRENCN